MPTEVELLRVERSEQAKAQGVAVAGYGLKSRWLAKENVTFAVGSHPTSKPYPIVAIAPRFYLAPRSVKLRLRKPLRDFLRSE